MVICISLRQANKGAPNKSTDITNAYTNYNLTLLFYKPSSLALFLILRNAILACLTLTDSIWPGDLLLALISIPRYLKVSHYYNSTLSTYNFPLQCKSITSVFLVLMTRSLHLQKAANTEISFYNYNTWGAIKTMSSANANINKLRQATVYSLLYCLVYDYYTILALI